MLEFQIKKLTERITRIQAPVGEFMYLVEGDHTAALLDTGRGFGHLKPVVDRLTHKPVIVLTTHGHVDHAMGSIEFDTVYLSHRDEYIYRPHSVRDYRLYNLGWIPEDEVLEPVPFSHFHDLKDGDCFDLGGEVIEVYECPGHTKGTMVFLMREERVLLSGDACNSYTYLFETYSLPVEAYEESLKSLLPRIAGKFDRVLASHGDGELPVSILEEVIQVCEDIKAGRTDDIPMESRGVHGFLAKAFDENGHTDVGAGQIVYSKERIWKAQVKD